MTLSDKAIRKFEIYADLIVEYNKVMNLTAISEKNEIDIKHFLDSISPLALGIIKSGMKIADVGTGAGFPGLPLKIADESLDVSLIDSLLKRVEFLKNVCEKTELSNVRCLHLRAEEAGRDASMRESFDVVLTRAVAHLAVISEYCLPLVKPGGLFVAMKGADISKELEESNLAITTMGGKVEKVSEVLLPGDIKHTIISIRKISQTPSKYPRRTGKPVKSPIK